MSDESTINAPVSLRRSFQLGGARQLVLGAGLWLVIGLLSLYDSLTGPAGQNTGWVYLSVGFLFLPTLLSHIEIRSWMLPGGGSYRIIKAVERNNVSFLSGWLYLLGWAAVSGLIATSIGQHVVRLANLYVDTAPSAGVIAAVVVTVLLMLLFLRVRPAWQFSYLLVIVLIVLILVTVSLLVGQFVFGELERTELISGGGRFFEAIGIAVASMWILETTSSLQGLRAPSPSERAINTMGGLLATGAAALVVWSLIPARSLPGIAETVLPGAGRQVFLAFSIGMMLVLLHVFSEVSLRQLQQIGIDGCFARWVLKRDKRLATPGRLLALMALLAAGASLINDPVLLAKIAAFVILTLQLIVNITAVFLARQKRAANRSVILPLWPSIQATGAAIVFLLYFALSFDALLIGIGWLALSGLMYLQYGREQMREQQLGVTVFQDELLNVTSTYPVIVPVANPATASGLVRFAAEAARAYNGHLTIVQVIPVPEDEALTSARSEAEASLSVLNQSLQDAQTYGVPVEGVTRLSRRTAQGIIDTINEENASLVVMGWHGGPEQELSEKMGALLEEILENAPCDVVILHGDWHESPRRALVPVAGGPHAPVAADLGLSLTAANGGEVTLLNVVRERATSSDVARGEEALSQITSQLERDERLVPRVQRADSPIEGILEVAEDHDVILMGASETRSGIIERHIFGELQLQVARRSGKPVALVRHFTGFGSMVTRRTFESVSDLLPTLTMDEQDDLVERMRSAALPSVNYFVLIFLSAMIATLGLLLNSAAVIIGAMLVAPLMSPIVAAGIGITRGDIKTFRKGLTATLQGLLASVFFAILLTLISPLASATPEVLARTQPTLLDMLVALISGAAGAYAIGRREVGEALPGVAIAAALMPPICTIGIGIALGRIELALGALLLFTTNLFSIIVAAAFIFLLLGVRPPERENRQRQLQQGLRFSLIILLIISIPLGLILNNQVRQDSIRSASETIITETIQEWGDDVELVDIQFQFGLQSIEIEGTVYVSGEVENADILALEDLLNAYVQRDIMVRLFVVEGIRLQQNE
ncbi:MAG: TIGR00341 family protein [Anaerolineae bacterium]